MKYAIMSDAHANPKALETALADARKAHCGKFILLGDVTEMLDRRLNLPGWLCQLLLAAQAG